MKNIKRILAFLLCTIICLYSNITVMADTQISGVCGENATYTFDTNSGTLIINGNGAIECYSFKNNTDIKKVVINEGITEIGYGAFKNCQNLTEITLPSTLKTINADETPIITDTAFEGCEKLNKVNYNGTLEQWAEINFNYVTTTYTNFNNGWFYNEYDQVLYAYKSCYSANPVYYTGNLSIADTITDKITVNNKKINSWAFSGIKNISTVNIGENVEVIEEAAFNNCKDIVAFNVDENNKYYSSVDGVLFNKDKTELIKMPPKTQVTEYTVPDTVTSICNNAFNDCTNLLSITIPNSVKQIGYSAFNGCSNLQQMSLSFVGRSLENRAIYNDDSYYKGQEIPTADTLFGYIFGNVKYDNSYSAYQCISRDCKSSATGKWGFVYDAGGVVSYIPSSLKTVEIRNGNILSGAFYGCRNIENIILGDNIDYIYERAFYSCLKLKNIDFGNSLRYIKTEAFYNCIELTSVEFPNSVRSIMPNAFYNCPLKNVHLSNNTNYIGDNAMSSKDISNVTSCVKEEYFAHCSKGLTQKLAESVFLNGTNYASQCLNFNSVASQTKLFLGNDIKLSALKPTSFFLKNYDTYITDEFDEIVTFIRDYVPTDNNLMAHTTYCFYNENLQLNDNISLLREVTYNAGNGTLNDNFDGYIIYLDNEQADLSFAATLDGCKFVGWSETPNGDVLTSDYSITKDTTLYAVYETSITTNHLDEQGKKICDAETTYSVINKEYITTPKTIYGYELISVPENATGITNENPIVVNYTYCLKDTCVTINYLDENGNELAESDIINGKCFDEYSTTPKELYGYKLIATPDNAVGLMTEEQIIVNYIYQKVPMTINEPTKPTQTPQPNNSNINIVDTGDETNVVQYLIIVLVLILLCIVALFIVNKFRQMTKKGVRSNDTLNERN